MIRNRWLAGGVSLGLLGAVLWPIAQNWREAPHDDFPLSSYPMFSHRRGKRAARRSAGRAAGAAPGRGALAVRLAAPAGQRRHRGDLLPLGRGQGGRRAGLGGWAGGEVLRSRIAVDGLRKELFDDRAAPLAYTLYQQVGLFRVLAVGSLLAELGAPLALLHRRGGQLWAANAFALHWGIYALMKITFRYQLVGLPFVPFFAAERALAPLLGEEPTRDRTA